ncbi:biotin/lipoyl-binding protein [Moritella sp. 36]|uniref:HlyD family secretion protein n=1 Tax=Moritella sp. 36 TaxID=2746233 RepID=UPI001BA5DB1E|nr:efflux RND transporter periplasmic adaptor subunit [Moritella sp. 36]QUM90999.1 biotin/lipoyl-binding protein [Moritella sp. 36]
MSNVKTGIIAVVALAVIGWLVFEFNSAYEPKSILLQGQIEAEQYNISSKIPGRIASVDVKKGELVSQGQLIFSLASPELEAKLAQAKAGRSAASAMRKQAESGAREQQVIAANDQWKKAQAAAELMEKTYQRVDNLYKDGVLPEQKRDEVYTKWQAAKYTQNAAYQGYQMAKEGARKETKQAAIEQERMAEGVVAEVESYTKDTKQYAQRDGEVVQILLKEGELAPTGFPVVSIVDINDSWAVFNIREDLLPRLKKGTILTARIPALGEATYQYQISHIAVMGDYATWRSTDSAKGFDLRTFEIEARPVKPIADLRVGMSVLVELAPSATAQ